MNPELLKKQHEAIFMFDVSSVEEKKRPFAINCAVNANQMAAYIKIETNEKESAITEYDILCALHKKNIRAGINYAEVSNIISGRKFNQPLQIATGFLPENGADAELVPQVELREFAPGQPPQGAHVDIDQPIVIKKPATPGATGLTVLGAKIPAVPGKDIAFQPGSNVTVSKDGLKLLAGIPGIAGIASGKTGVKEDPNGQWEFRVQARKEGMEAVLIIVPGAGPQPPINDELIAGLLEKAKVVFGIDPDIARTIPPQISVPTFLKIAAGRQPAAGKNAALIEHFRKNAEKDQNLFLVKKEQLIVEKTPEQSGEDGMNVFGAPVPTRAGKPVEIVPGVNTQLSDDGKKLFSTIEGYVSRVNEAYCVVECREFNPAQKPMPPSINFDGMVKIVGDVPKGHMITAGHHVVVEGNIIGAEVVAGGFLQVGGDIQDCTDKKIQAASDMFLTSCKRARIRSGGNIYISGPAQNCEIISSGGIYNTDKGSFSLVGGRVVAASSIEADEIGSPENIQTVIEAGLPLPIRVRYEQAVSDLDTQSRKFTAVEKELKRLALLKKEGKITPAEFENMRKFLLLYKMLTEKIGQLKANINSMLNNITKSHTGASVTARNSVYPGTVLKVGIFKQDIDQNPGAMLFKANKDNTGLTTRKLASKMKKEMTIMFTDIVGYSTYTSIHGDMAASALVDKHNELLFPCVEDNKGRIIKTIGDSIMAVFELPVNAVQAGIDMQRALEEHNQDEPDEHKIKVRIGINTGDGIPDGNDVFGDVVNMAARVESLTDGDEIKISISTYKAVYDKLDIEFRSLGLKKLKGKEELIEIFEVIWQE